MKKFLIKISYTVLPVWGIIVGLVLYISIYATPRMTGDIGKLALIPFGHSYNATLEKNIIKDTLFSTIKHKEELASINVKILTIGDSFSQQKNKGYQNYISQKGISIANCYRNLYSNPLQYAYNLLEENIFDSTNVKIIVIESVERDFETNIMTFERGKIEPPKENKPKAPNKWSISRARDFILYRLGYENPIYHANLDAGYFESDNPDKLYFYKDDIDSGTGIKKKNEAKVQYVYNTLRQKAYEKGIKLFFLIAVDKYDLYQKHIINNEFPRKTVNEDIKRIIGDNSDIIFSKYNLLPLIEKQEKDIFLYNDTHWSYKASKIIADVICKKIEQSAGN